MEKRESSSKYCELNFDKGTKVFQYRNAGRFFCLFSVSGFFLTNYAKNNWIFT